MQTDKIGQVPKGLDKSHFKPSKRRLVTGTTRHQPLPHAHAPMRLCRYYDQPEHAMELGGLDITKYVASEWAAALTAAPFVKNASEPGEARFL
jgi:hypothetical protein